jgi:uncharacterized protein (UPF0303 family)
MFSILELQPFKEAREKAGYRLDSKICFYIHSCLLYVAMTGKNKNSFIHIRDEGMLRQKLSTSSVVPPSLRSKRERHFVAITGLPVADYLIHQRSLPYG